LYSGEGKLPKFGNASWSLSACYGEKCWDNQEDGGRLHATIDDFDNG